MNLFTISKLARKKIKDYKYRRVTPIEMRHDDVYLVSFPRSGNTWMIFLLANVMIEYCKLKKEVNFFNLTEFVPDIHISRHIPINSRFHPFPRIIKSHSSYNPYYHRVFWIVRDPRDVMISFWHYQKDLHNKNITLSDFIRTKKWGIDSWIKHTNSWLNAPPSTRIQLIRYEDLKANPKNELSRILFFLGIKVSEGIIDKAIEKATFENMKKIEEETHSFTVKQREDFQHVRKGKIGQAELSDIDRHYIEKKAGKIMEHFGYL